MWVWIYGLAISLFLIFHELEFSNVIALIPLIVICSLGFLEFIFCIVKKFDSKFEDIANRDVISTGYLWSMSLILLILIALQINGTITFTSFFITLTLLILSVSLIYVLLKGKYVQLVNSPLNIRIANILSFIATISTYLAFYGVEYDWIDDWLPLIPFSLSLIFEIYIVVTLYKGENGITQEFSIKAAKNRLIHMSCVGILLLCAVIHYATDIGDLFLYSAAAIAYFLGIVIMVVNKQARICSHLSCMKKSKWSQLKEPKGEEVEEGISDISTKDKK